MNREMILPKPLGVDRNGMRYWLLQVREERRRREGGRDSVTTPARPHPSMHPSLWAYTTTVSHLGLIALVPTLRTLSYNRTQHGEL